MTYPVGIHLGPVSVPGGVLDDRVRAIGLGGVFVKRPYTLAYRRMPLCGVVPSGFVAGAVGLPADSTTAILGVAPPVRVWSALPLLQLS